MPPPSQYQDLDFNGARYRLIVENGHPSAAWKAYGFVYHGSGFQHAFEADAGSETEAKGAAHGWAVNHSGAQHEQCDGSCVPWQQTFSNAAGLWFSTGGRRTKPTAVS